MEEDLSDCWLGSVVAAAGGFIIVGIGSGPQDHFLLYSTDGFAWERSDHAAHLLSLTSFGEKLVAVDRFGNLWTWDGGQ